MADTVIDLWDWRRRVATLYAEVRQSEDAERAWHHWRTTRDRLFKEHPQSPLDEDARTDFSGNRHFDYDSAYRFHVTLEDTRGEAETLDGGDDGPVRLLPFAVTRGLDDRLGGELTLFWIGGYGGGVFLPFTDATSGVSTYGGGRYLLDTVKGADLGTDTDDRFVLDFNFAYNPSCAHAGQWVCPLAPPANRLPVAVEAGERTPG